MAVPGGGDGSEPRTARSAVGLRLVLAVFGVLACGVATVLLVELAREHTGDSRTVATVLAGVAVFGALVGVADIAVLVRRRRSR